MSDRLHPLRLTGASILRDATMQQRTVAISGGCISAGPYPAVDLSGYLILPGMIDLSSQSLAHHQRRGGLQAALRATDKDLSSAGITTAWVTTSWGWEAGGDGATALAALLEAFEATPIRTALRAQLLLDVMCAEADSQLPGLLGGALASVLLCDALPERLAAAETDPAAFADWARAEGHDPAKLLEALRRTHARRSEMPRRLCRLAESFDAHGVVYGSLHDPDGETREMYSMLGAKICASPASYPAAHVAHAVGDPVVMSAQDLLCPDQTQVSAATLIARRKCAALCSGEYPSDLLSAVFRLVDDGQMPLPRAWDLVSTMPARIMRLPDRGEIAPGKRADLVIIREDTRDVEATITGGRLSFLCGEAANRFMAAGSGPLAIAAA